MQHVSPLPMEFMSMSQMLCSNALFGGRQEAELPLWDNTWTLSWQRTPHQRAYSCVLSGLCGAEAWTLWLDDASVLYPKNSPIPIEIFSTMPANLAGVAFGVLIEPLLTQAKDFFLKKIILQDVNFGERILDKNSSGFAFCLKHESHIVHGFLETSENSYILEHICSWWQEEKSLPRPMTEIPLFLTPILDSFNLPIADIGKIQQYDCIFGTQKSEQYKAVLNIHCYINKMNYMLAMLEGNTLTIQGVCMQEELENIPMERSDTIQENSGNTETNMQEAIQASLDLNNLSVKVDFALDTLAMSVGKLASIQEGEVFVTTCDMSAPVSILVNGKCIGKGKLVDVAGRIGVQIQEIKA